MKFLKNFVLLGLLMGACIPSDTRTANQPALYPGNYTLHWTTALFFNKHACAAIIIAPIALFYIPYVLFTRHNAAENFIKKQEAIESYSIAIRLNQPRGKQPLEQSFTGLTYKTVIKETLEWAKAHQTPGFTAVFKPSIKLVKNEKLYTLRSVKKSTLPGYSTKNPAFWKNLNKLLTARFKLPTSENITHATKIKQGILSGFIWTAVSVFFGIPFIPLATLSIPFLALSQHSSAKNFVEQPEDIESSIVAVKIRHLCKTIKEQSFTSPDPKLVITQALQYAQQEHIIDSRVFFEPSIKLVDCEKIYSLRRITKAKLSKNSAAQDSSWKKLETALADRLIVPTEIVTSTPYQGRLAHFGAAVALWIAAPPCILI